MVTRTTSGRAGARAWAGRASPDLPRTSSPPPKTRSAPPPMMIATLRTRRLLEFLQTLPFARSEPAQNRLDQEGQREQADQDCDRPGDEVVDPPGDVGAHQLSVVGQTQHGEELDRQQQTVQDVNADQHLDERQTG